MKRVTLIVLVVLWGYTGFHYAFSQDCTPGTAMSEISANSSTAQLTLNGGLWTSNASSSGLTIQNDSGIDLPVLEHGGIWIGGVDPGGNLKLAGSTYGAVAGRTDFYPGPINQFTGTTDEATCRNWDRFFRVTKEDINEHQRLYYESLSSGQPYTEDMIPENIKRWPGIGNPYFESIFGFTLPDRGTFADFKNWGGTRQYEPLKGDLPTVQFRRNLFPNSFNNCQLIPDEMVFWVINDAGGIHSETNADPIQVEIQITAFVFKDNARLDDAIFYKYKIINHAVEDLTNTYINIWSDAESCDFGERAGCDTTRNLTYFYNQKHHSPDGQEQCLCPSGVGSCEKLPVVGIGTFNLPTTDVPRLDNSGMPVIDSLTGDTVFEKQYLDMSSFNYYNNSSLGSPSAATTDPQTAQEYYNYMRGRWRDGSSLTSGGDGYVGGNAPTRFAFPSSPNCKDAACWSMCSDSLPGGDRRMLQSFGPFTLNPGDVQEFIFGTFTAEVDDSECPDIVPLQQKKDYIQALFDNCFDRNVSAESISSSSKEIVIFPNPFSNRSGSNLTISNLPRQSTVRIYDLNGKTVANLGQAESETMTWTPTIGLLSGIYFIEVRNEKFGKRVLKWVLTK